MMVPSLGMVVLAAAAATTAVPTTPSPSLVRRHVNAAPQAVLYASHQSEFYLSAADIEWVRPGFEVTIESLTIGADRKPVIEVSFKDDLDQPLDRAGKKTPGPLSISFILARYDAAHRDYVSYNVRKQTSPITGDEAWQGTTDSGGTWTDLELGRARYTFRTALPEGFDATATHTLGVQAYRNMTSIIPGKYYYSNLMHDFRPDGQAVTERWDAIETATCNACHDAMGFHGSSSRREVKLCVLCHNNTQSIDPDTGNSFNMETMIHKIHGAHVLANGYTIIGHNQSVHDYSHIAYPQDVRNCTTCHKATKRDGTPNPEGDIWFTKPSRTACGSCHDHIDWTTGEGHVAGAQADDAACASCHIPQGEIEFDASIRNAHTVPTKSTQLPGITMEILSVDNATPGNAPVVTFKITDKAGHVVDPRTLTSCSFLFGGPTTDYTWYKRQTCKDPASTTFDGEIATTTFAAAAALPADASGTYTMSADYYNYMNLNPAPTSSPNLQVRDAGLNPIFAVAVGDAQPNARRAVVDLDKCNACHDTLALHGGQRYKIEECVICHHPNMTDVAVRPADKGAPESVHFKYMIHRIHTGHEIGRDYTIYGNRSSEHNYNGVGYPGDRRNCAACHITTATGQQNFELPLPEVALATATPRDFFTPTQPSAATCLSCHTSRDTAAHAWANTVTFPGDDNPSESCTSCHGVGRDFSVAKVHAR